MIEMSWQDIIKTDSKKYLLEQIMKKYDLENLIKKYAEKLPGIDPIQEIGYLVEFDGLDSAVKQMKEAVDAPPPKKRPTTMYNPGLGREFDMNEYGEMM